MVFFVTCKLSCSVGLEADWLLTLSALSWADGRVSGVGEHCLVTSSTLYFSPCLPLYSELFHACKIIYVLEKNVNKNDKKYISVLDSA